MSAQAETQTLHSAEDPSVSDSSAGDGHDEPAPRPENPAAAAIRIIPALLGELKEYASHYITARVDGLKLTVRNIVIYAAFGVVGLIAGAGIVVTAVALVVVGIAHALGALLGHHEWLGDMIVGLLILGGVALAIYVPLSKLFKTSRTKTEQKYEGKRIQQRVDHGRDVSERAAGANGSKKAAPARGKSR